MGIAQCLGWLPKAQSAGRGARAGTPAPTSPLRNAGRNARATRAWGNQKGEENDVRDI